MKIQCENCAIQHELDPPSWVVSSGRAFRFRCSSCGHSQSVQPESESEPEEDAEAPASANPEDAPATPASSDTDNDANNTQEERPADLPDGPEGAVFLKQNGQIYMVRDWHTLTRWIQERRVDRHDLVSEGGVRWQPIGSHEDLVKYFVDTQAPAAQRSNGPASLPPQPALSEEQDAPEPASPPFEEDFSAPLEPEQPFSPPADMPFAPTTPLGGETPFLGGGTINPGHWHDDDTEGIPTGLPLLPTEEGGEEAFDEPFGENPSFALPPPSDEPEPHQDSIPDLSEMPVMGELPPPDISGAFPIIDDTPFDDAPPPLPTLTPFAKEPASDWNDLMVAEEPPPGTLPPVPDGFEDALFGSDPDEEDSDIGTIDDFSPTPAFESFDSGASQDGGNSEVDAWSDYSDSSDVPPPISNRNKAALAIALALLMVAMVFGVNKMVRPEVAVPPNDEPDIADVMTPQNTISAEAPDEPLDHPEDGVEVPEEVLGDPEDGTADAVEEENPPGFIPEELPAFTPAAQPDPVPAPQPDPVPVPRPDPAPEPKAEPAPKQPSLSKLIDQGWNTIDDNPAAAADFFKKALAVSSTNALANEGYGYAKLKLGDAATGKKHLCKAQSSGDPEIQAEVSGILGQYKLSCP